MSQKPKKKAVISPPYQSSVELYRALFEQATDGIFIADAQGNYIEVNQRGCEMLGYTRKEILDLSITDLIPVEDLTHDPLQLDALRAGKTMLKERLLRCKNGRLLSVEINTRMLSDGNFLGMVRDISKRKQAEQNIALMNFALDNVHEAAFLIDENAQFHYVNEESCRVLGYTRNELLNMSVSDLDSDFPPEQWADHWDELKTHRSLIFESRHKTKDGRIIPVEINANYFEYDGQGYDLALVHNITERKQAEQALQESEERFRLLMEHSPFGIQIFDMDGTLVQVNQTWQKLWGVRAEEVVGTYNAFDDPQINLLGLRSFVERAFAGEEVYFQDVHYAPSQFDMPGRERWVRAYGYRIPVQGKRSQQVVLLTEDITKRKQAETKIRESKEQLHSILNTVPDYILTIEPGGLIRFINHTYPGVTIDEIIGTNVIDWISQEYRSEFQQMLTDAFTTGQPYELETVGIGENGMLAWYLSRLGPVIREGKVVTLTIIGQDITQRKQAEEALRTNEGRLKQAQQLAQMGIWEWDIASDKTTWSAEMFPMYGIKPETFTGKGEDYLNFTHPDDRQLQQDNLQKAFEDATKLRTKTGQTSSIEPDPQEFRIIRPDGSLCYVQGDAVAIVDEQGQPTRMLGILMDITATKEREEALRQSEGKWRTLAETAPDVIMTVNRDNNLLFVNRSVTGADPEQFIGKNFYDFVMDEYLDLVKEHIESVFQTGIPTSYEVQGPKGLNPPRWFITRVGAVQRDEEVIAVTIIATDITERKQASEALRVSEERFRALYHENPSMFFTLDAEGIISSVNDFGATQLGYTKGELEGQPVMKLFYEEDKAPVREHLKICLQNPGRVYYWQFRKVRKTGSLMWVQEFVRAINGPDGDINILVVCQDVTERKQLEAKNEQLTTQFYQAQKMESIGRLAGGIAHDFNNLLVPIIGYIDLNLINLPPESKLFADLTQVSKAANQAADLTRQILAFSRQQVLELRLLELNIIIEEFKKMLQRLIGEDIELQTFLSPLLFSVKADRGQIEQVLMNLAINARDAMPAGGKLIIETGNIFLDEAYLEKYASDLLPGHYVMLAVSDTGQGMDAKTLKHIFDPFFTTKESGKGTGLGLSTVFGIIKQHQGHIWVYSEPGEGTTFKIYLPKAKEAIQTTVPKMQESISIYGTETVMVVEDDEMVRKLVCETLEAHGYDVIEAQSPTDCLELAAGRDTIHLLLTDVIMPKMNGKELYQKLITIHPNSRVLYMSGYTNSVIFHHSVLDESMNFLQKPFTVQNLARKVKEVLG